MSRPSSTDNNVATTSDIFNPWGHHLAAWTLTTGALESLKWLGLMWMTLDHVNTVFYASSHPWMYALGRMAFPIFAMTLAFQSVRLFSQDDQASPYRLAIRLLLYGVIAAPFCMFVMQLENGWQPINVLFTFCAGVLILILLRRRSFLRVWFAINLFLITGLFVEFLWFGLLVFLSAYWFFSSRTAVALTALVLSVSALYFVNGNQWALASIPLIVVIGRMDLKVPRIRHFFYAYYPAHLALFSAIKAWA